MERFDLMVTSSVVYRRVLVRKGLYLQRQRRLPSLLQPGESPHKLKMSDLEAWADANGCDIKAIREECGYTPAHGRLLDDANKSKRAIGSLTDRRLCAWCGNPAWFGKSKGLLNNGMHLPCSYRARRASPSSSRPAAAGSTSW
jgi:hypothetical protein